LEGGGGGGNDVRMLVRSQIAYSRSFSRTYE